MLDNFRMLLCSFFIDKLINLAPKNEEGLLLIRYIRDWALADLELLSKNIVNKK